MKLLGLPEDIEIYAQGWGCGPVGGELVPRPTGPWVPSSSVHDPDVMAQTLWS